MLIRRLLLSSGVVALSTAVVAATIVASSGARRTASDGPGPRYAPAVYQSSHADKGIVPGFEHLTPDQRLDRTLSLPGTFAVVGGHVGSARSIRVPDMTFPAGTRATEFSFTVTDIYSHVTTSPYRTGETISLRVPGGSDSSGTTVAEDAPVVTPNGDIFVVVRDQGVIVGGNTDRVLVASLQEDVFTVTGADDVVGQGTFSGLVEPVRSFIAHFRH